MKYKLILIFFLILTIKASSQSEIGILTGAVFTTSNLKVNNNRVLNDYRSIKFGGYFKTYFSDQYIFESDIAYSLDGVGSNFKSYTLSVPVLFGQKFSKTTFLLGPDFNIDLGERFTLLNTKFKDNLFIYGVLGISQSLSKKVSLNIRYGNLIYNNFYKSTNYINYSLSSNAYQATINYNLSRL